MHLDGQVGGGVDGLHEQREHVALAVAEQLAVVGPQPGEGLAGELARGDDVIAVGDRRDGPALAHGTIRDVVSKVARHAASTQILPLKSGTSLMIESITYVLSCESTFGPKARTPDPTSIVLTPHCVR